MLAASSPELLNSFWWFVFSVLLYVTFVYTVNIPCIMKLSELNPVATSLNFSLPSLFDGSTWIIHTICREISFPTQKITTQTHNYGA